MARIAFLNLPARSHVNPTLPVATELVKRGHTVNYYDSEDMRGLIEPTGAVLRPYPGPIPDGHAVAALLDDGNLARVALALLRATERLTPWLIKQWAGEPPDVVAFDSTCLWGMVAARRLRLASVGLFSAFVPEDHAGRLTWRERALLLRQGLLLYPRFVRAVGRLRRQFSAELPPTGGLFPARGARNILFTCRELQPMTSLIDDSFEFVGPSLTDRGDDEGFSATIREAPLIYVAVGSILTRRELVLRCFDAFADLPLSVVLSAGPSTRLDSLGEPPSNFVVRNHVPQLRVLERAALFVHHGGANSVNEALYYGVPQVIVPQHAELLFNARQVERTGAGVILGARPPYGRVSATELRRAATDVLGHPRFGERARTLAAALKAGGGYRRAADQILSASAQLQSLN